MPDYPPSGDEFAQEPRIRRPPGFIDRLVVPTSVLADTVTGLALGREREILAYWIGTAVPESPEGESRALVTTVAFPRIYSEYAHFRLAEGQMGEITGWCADHGLWVLAQLHTHPTDESHSLADEAFPASTRPGFLSVVFPFFANFANVRHPGWRAYEALGEGRWREIDPNERIEVIQTVWLPQELK